MVKAKKAVIADEKIAWPKRLVYWFEGTGMRTMKISIPFTWSLHEAREKIEEHSLMCDTFIVGGPGIYLMPDYFNDMPQVSVGYDEPGVLQRINPMATRTTTGCVRHCKFCAIGTGKIEGDGFRELADWPDLPVLADNNLLAASQSHFDRVIDRLIRWGWADFEQGLDSRLLADYHAERIAQIKSPMVRLALDSMDYADQWENAFSKLRRAGIAKKNIRSYALIGHTTGEEEAWRRCAWIEGNGHGIKALPMWFHPLDALEWNAVTPEQAALGWDDTKRKGIMDFYYWHRGSKHECLAA
jgi:hypothetical protein